MLGTKKKFDVRGRIAKTGKTRKKYEFFWERAGQ